MYNNILMKDPLQLRTKSALHLLKFSFFKCRLINNLKLLAPHGTAVLGLFYPLYLVGC